MSALAPGGGPGRAPLDRKGPIREALALCARHFRYALLFSALVNVAYLAPTLYMLLVYDMVVPSASDLTLVFVTLALSATLLLLTYLDQVRQRILAAASMRLDRVFAARIFRRVMAAPLTGQPVRLNQLMRDFDTIRATVTGPAALAMFDAPWIPIYIAVCFYVHPLLGGMALGGAAVLFVLAIYNERTTRDHFKRAADANAASYAAQESAGASAEVVRALGMTDAFAAQFEAARTAASLPQIEANRANGQIGGLIRFLRLFLQSVSLGVGAWLAIHNQISGGAIFAASMLAGRALSPIDLVVAQWRSVSSAMTSYRNIREVLIDRSTAAPTHLPDPEPSLTLEKVSAATPTRDRVLLRDISMGAKKGMVVGVLGPSGAGKTTLLQIIANARGADGGEIRLGGARYADWDSQRLGRLIGYLPQDCVLFPGTVKDNISRFDSALGEDAAAVDQRAVEAAQAAGVHELILALPKGYDTPLGPRGRGLSAGQQQRVALARALYGEPLLLVFDEPNSNLDAEGEAKLVQVVESLRERGAMVIIAAHRMGIIGAADYLAILKDGQLDRFGPRQEVLDSLKPQAAPPRASQPQPGPPQPGPSQPGPPQPSQPQAGLARPGQPLRATLR